MNLFFTPSSSQLFNLGILEQVSLYRHIKHGVALYLSTSSTNKFIVFDEMVYVIVDWKTILDNDLQYSATFFCCEMYPLCFLAENLHLVRYKLKKNR